MENDNEQIRITEVSFNDVRGGFLDYMGAPIKIIDKVVGYTALMITGEATVTARVEHHLFDGWNTKSDGSGTIYDVKGTINVSSDVTLYAQWVPFTYAVMFDKNAADATARWRTRHLPTTRRRP